MLTRERYCVEHAKADKARWRMEQESRRETAARRGYDSAWQKAREAFLAKHPLCKSCYERGRIVTATFVDHIVPHRGEKKLFWDRANWQPLCKSCSDAKTQREIGERRRGARGFVARGEGGQNPWDRQR